MQYNADAYKIGNYIHDKAKDSERDRQMLNLDGFLDQAECFDGGAMEGFGRFQNTLSLVGLSFLEAYLENRLWFAIKYRSTAPSVNKVTALVLVGHDQCDVTDTTACFRPGFIGEIKPVDSHFRLGGDEDNVLIGDVELMKPVNVELPAFVRLYVVQDGVNNSLTRCQSLQFMSMDGSHKRLPVFSEGESPPITPFSVIGVCGDMVGVVEGSAEVVNSIAKNSASVFGEGDILGGSSAFQKALLILSPQSLSVASSVVPEDGFELVDVMFGPFGF